MKWNPITKSFPRPMENVLGLVEYDFDGKHYRHPKIVYYAGGGKWEPLGRDTDVVTHWCFLPELPPLSEQL